MAEFRIEGVATTGKVIQGIIEADNLASAKQKAQQMAAQRKLKITKILSRAKYLYKVKKGDEKPIKGEQRAFTKGEVHDALTKLGYKVISINKELVDLSRFMKPPTTDIVAFVRVSADLLRQKLPYNEILQLMVNDIQNPVLRDAIKEINTELKQGKDSEKVFLKQETVLGKFTANMLGLASKSGNMSEIYDSTAKFLERRAEFKKNLKSALIMPSVTLIALAGACLYYIASIFPSMAEVFYRIIGEEEFANQFPWTYASLQVSYFLQENYLYLLIATIVPTVLLVRYFTTERGLYVLNKYMIKIPVLGTLFHKMSIEIFCRVFYALYSGSGENIDVIRLAAEACGNRYMESQIKNVAIPMMIEKGAGITESFEATGVFTKTALSRFHSGSETGTVKNTAQQLAEYYEKETSYKLRNAIDFIQLWVNLIIMVVLLALTLVSTETASFHPKQPGMK